MNNSYSEEIAEQPSGFYVNTSDESEAPGNLKEIILLRRLAVIFGLDPDVDFRETETWDVVYFEITRMEQQNKSNYYKCWCTTPICKGFELSRKGDPTRSALIGETCSGKHFTGTLARQFKKSKEEFEQKKRGYCANCGGDLNDKRRKIIRQGFCCETCKDNADRNSQYSQYFDTSPGLTSTFLKHTGFKVWFDLKKYGLYPLVKTGYDFENWVNAELNEHDFAFDQCPNNCGDMDYIEDDFFLCLSCGYCFEH